MPIQPESVSKIRKWFLRKELGRIGWDRWSDEWRNRMPDERADAAWGLSTSRPSPSRVW